MSKNWHFAKNGEGHGPITLVELKELATSGQLSPDDLVWREDMNEWRNAGSVKGLFQSTVIKPQKILSPPPLPKENNQIGNDTLLTPKRLLLAFLIFTVLLAILLPFVRRARDAARLSQIEHKKDNATQKNGQSVDLNTNRAGKDIVPTKPVVVGNPVENAISKIEVKQSDTKSKETDAVDSTAQWPSSHGTVVRGNVALSSKGATVNKDIRNPWAVNDGKPPDSWREYAKASLNKQIVVTLDSVYQLRSIRIQFVGNEGYRYSVEVSADGKNFEMVQDRRRSGSWSGWQKVSFDPRPVKSIRVIGTYDIPNQTGIRIGEIEAFCDIE